MSFAVRRAEVFGFLGPNGAGKTTTLKMLAGLLAPTSGSGRVAGFDIVREQDEIKLRIGYMSQLFSLYTDLTVDENVRFFGGLYGVTGRRLDARRDAVLAMARLDDQRHRLVAELPLGFRQRLALGCAVLHEPPILFLDEPTSGVDPVSRRTFWDLIYELAAGGTTVFVTTHYMEEAEHCHRLALMNRGALVALDTPEGLRRGLGRAVLEVSTPDAAAAAAAFHDADGVLSAGLFGRAVHVMLTTGREGVEAGEAGKATDGAASGVEQVRRILAGAGVAVDGVRPIAPSLEDVFVARVTETGGAVED